MKSKSTEAFRRSLIRDHGHKYRRAWGLHPGQCFYCADPATVLDHVPPLAWADALESMRRRSSIPYALVPACCDCNTTLGDRALLSMCERAAHIERRLAKTYEKRFSLWSEDETREMSPMFQTMIKARRSLLAGMLQRIRHLERCAIHGDEWLSDALETL